MERHEIATPGDFTRLSDEQLMAQFEATVKRLRAITNTAIASRGHESDGNDPVNGE